MTKNKIEVVIVGAGFAGLSAAKKLGNKPNIHVTIIDKRNHHLFQPLLYQVATAALSATEVATPIRSILSKYKNIDVVLAEVTRIDCDKKIVETNTANYSFEYLIMASGSIHNYFGNNDWGSHAIGMKSVEEALNIRKKILMSFEIAESTHDINKRKKHLTFVIFVVKNFVVK